MKTADAVAVAPLAADPRRDDQLVGAVAVQHHALFAVEHPAGAVLHRRRRDIGEVVARVPLGLGESKVQAAVGDLAE